MAHHDPIPEGDEEDFLVNLDASFADQEFEFEFAEEDDDEAVFFEFDGDLEEA